MKNRAFTLIELLVVVLIIGILAAIAVPQYQKAVAKAELAQIVSLIKSVRLAQEEYYLANNRYATSMNELSIDFKNSDIKCNIAYSNYYYACYNKNFALCVYGEYRECGARTTDTNSALAYACKDLTQSEGSIRNSFPCSLLMGKNCFTSSRSGIF